MKYRLRAEHPTHFEVEDGKGVFKVAKAGLDSELVKRIQSFADGGAVGGGAGEDVPPLETFEMGDSGVSPDMRISGKGPQRLKTENEQYPKANAMFDDPRGSMPSDAPTAPNALTDENAAAPMAPGLLKFVTGLKGAIQHPIDTTLRGFKLSAEMLAPEAVKEKVAANVAENEKPSVTESMAPRSPRASGGAPRPAVAGGASPGRLGEPPAPATAAPDAEAAAMRGQADVAAREGAEQSSAIKDQMSRMADLEAHRQAMASQWDAEYKGQLRKYSEAVDRYSNTEIQPDRLWASRSTGDKMLAGVGMLLSAFGPGDVNRSVELIDRAVSQDIEVQKSNLERLGKSAGMHQNLLGIMREHFGDEMAAEAATRDAMMGSYELRLKEVAARYQGPQAQANAALGIAKSQEIRNQWRAEFDLKAKATASESQVRASEVAKNYAQANKLGATGGPQPGAAGLGELARAFGKTGPLSILAKNFSASDAGQYEHARKVFAESLTSGIKRGKYRDADVTRILALLPSAETPKGAGMKQLAQVQRMMQELGAAPGGGDDESGFEE